jgi:hypothetical protein
VAKAEEALVNAAKWGDRAAAYILGCWHTKHPALAHEADWWLASARDGSEVAAYLAARASDDDAFSVIEALPEPGSLRW